MMAISALALVAALVQLPGDSPADTVVPTPDAGRETVEALEYPPLSFDPPRADEHEVLGVTVFHLHDSALPLVDLTLLLRGGVPHFPREEMAAVTALPFLLRAGGTASLSPDSVDRRVDLLALQLSFGSGGGTTAHMNSLVHTLDEGMDLFREMLLEPGFDADAREVWRGQELESVRRRVDDPGGLAFSEFNRLLFGDHPVGWVMTEDDLAPDRLSEGRLRRVHRLLVCRERLILGISGDLDWDEAEPRLRRFLEPWPTCESDLEDPPPPELRNDPGVFLLPKDVDQTTIIMAHPGGIVQEDTPEYFASRIANHILGGSGFGSRIMTRVRTEGGLAYGASSIWTAPPRYEGLVGALTATRTDRAVEATQLLLEVLREFRDAPPREDEVEGSIDQLTNGYVFAFESPAQIVSRQISYRAARLPEQWLERYLEGLQEVTREQIHDVVQARVDPDRMTILLVGDRDLFDPGLEGLGPLYEILPDGTVAPVVNGP